MIFWTENDLKDYSRDMQAFVDRSILTRYNIRYTY